jgi:hypothetical protein
MAHVVRALYWIVLAGAVFCIPVQARTTAVTLPPGFAPHGAPGGVLAGSNVVYLDPRGGVYDFRLRIVSASGEDRPLAHLGKPTNTVVLAGSPALLVILRAFGSQTGSYTGAELLAGPPAGRFARVSACARPSLPGAHGSAPAFAVDGDTVAYVDDACRGQSAPLQLIVQSLTADAPPPRSFELPGDARVSHMAIVGPYVAYHLSSARGEEIVEDDWQTGAEVADVPDGGSLPCDSAGPPNLTVYKFCGLALQPDGKLARLLGSFAFHPGGSSRYDQAQDVDACQGAIDWRSPGDPTWRRVTSSACTAQPIRMAGDRILFAPSGSIEPLDVVDLQGNVRPLGQVQEIYGFDGQHVLVDEASCWTMSIVSQSVLGDDPPLPFIYGNRCPMRWSKPRLRLGAHSTFSISVICPNGCRGPLVSGTPSYVEGHSADFIVLPRQTRRVAIPLPRHGVIVREARRHGRVTVALNRFEVTTFDPRKSPESQARQSRPNVRFTVRPIRRKRVG